MTMTANYMTISYLHDCVSDRDVSCPRPCLILYWNAHEIVNQELWRDEESMDARKLTADDSCLLAECLENVVQLTELLED